MSEPIRQVVAAAESRRLEVTRVGQDATRIVAPALPRWSVELLVPDSVCEWFITVRDTSTGEVAHEDWCDHPATAGETDAELQHEMAVAIVRFIDAVHGRELRPARSEGVRLLGRRLLRSRILEVRVGSSTTWQDVWTLVWPKREDEEPD